MKNGKLAAAHPNHFGRRDFLQIFLMGLAGGRGLFANPLASSQIPLFREVADDVGLKFQHFTGATGEYYMPEIKIRVARNSRRRPGGNPETGCSATCSAKRGSCSSLTLPSKRA